MNIINEPIDINNTEFTGNWYCNNGELFFEVRPFYETYRPVKTRFVRKKPWYTFWMIEVDVKEKYEGEAETYFFGRAYVSENNLVDVNRCGL